MKSNKKAQIFEQGLVLVVFVVCAFALYTFFAYGQKIQFSFDNVQNALSLYDHQEETSFYLKEAGKLSVQEAYYATLTRVGENCPDAQTNRAYAIWNKECLMKNPDVETKFLFYINSSMQNFMKSYAFTLDSLKLENGQLSFIFRPVILNATLKENKIEVSYLYDFSFNLNLSENNIDLNFERISAEVFNKWDNCRNKDAAEIKNCMSALKLSGWDYLILNSDFFSELKNKNNYYFNNKFEPIIIKFQLEK